MDYEGQIKEAILHDGRKVRLAQFHTAFHPTRGPLPVLAYWAGDIETTKEGGKYYYPIDIGNRGEVHFGPRWRDKKVAEAEKARKMKRNPDQEFDLGSYYEFKRFVTDDDWE